MTMSMDYALATITGTYSYTVKEINEQGENNISDIEYDPSVYTVTVNVDENMDMSITYIKNGTNVDNSSESVDGISFENKMSVTAAAIDPAVKKVLNNAELQPGEFTFQLFDENNNLIDTKKGRVKKLSFFHTPFLFTCFIFQTDISLLILRLDQSVGIPLTLVNYIHLISLCIAEYEEIMSKKFHLDTCIFWIHRLDIEFLGTNDLNLFVLFIILVQICFLEVGS